MRVEDGRITEIRAVYDPRELIGALTPMRTDLEQAAVPEDLTRLWVERANAGDAEGLALLYETDAVLESRWIPGTSAGPRSRRRSSRC